MPASRAGIRAVKSLSSAPVPRLRLPRRRRPARCSSVSDGRRRVPWNIRREVSTVTPGAGPSSREPARAIELEGHRVRGGALVHQDDQAVGQDLALRPWAPVLGRLSVSASRPPG